MHFAAYSRHIYALAKVTDRAKFNPIGKLHTFLAPSKSANFPHVSPGELPDLIPAIGCYKFQPIAIGLQLLMLLAMTGLSL